MSEELVKVKDVELPSGIVMPATVLRDYGCKHCFIKAHEKCPFGYVDDQEHELGYCDQVVGYLASLSETGDNINDLKEKFQLQMQDNQAKQDLMEFKSLQKELRLLKESGESGPRVDALEMRIQAYKVWWAKLSEQAAKGWAKVNDRKARANNDDINVNHKIDLSQLHSLMHKAKQKVINAEVVDDE